MSEIAFSGSYQNPTVISIPGLVADPSGNPVQARWGEDLVFTFPDPGQNCTLRLIVKWTVEDTEELLTSDYSRTSDLGDIQFLVTGQDSRKLLQPGILYYGLLRVTDAGGGRQSYAEIASGNLMLTESASSQTTPSSEDVALQPAMPVVPLSYPDALLVLEGGASTNARFGFFQAPAFPLKCVGTELIVQDAPVGASLVLDLAAYGGAAQSKLTTLPDGQTLIQTTFGTPLTMAANSQWQAKVVQIGSTEPGASMQFRLKLQIS